MSLHRLCTRHAGSRVWNDPCLYLSSVRGVDVKDAKMMIGDVLWLVLAAFTAFVLVFFVLSRLKTQEPHLLRREPRRATRRPRPRGYDDR
jgi:hypothetical protein